MGRLQKIILFVCILGFLISSLTIGHYFWTGNKEEEAFEVLATEKKLETDTWSEKRQQLGEDYVGWLTLPGTTIDYPVMQNLQEPEYYMYRDYTGERSQSGTPFLVAVCDSNDAKSNLMIYGHNMNNRTMFSDLTKYQEVDYFKQNPIIRLETARGDQQTYQIFAVLKTSTIYDEYDLYNHIYIENEEAYQEFVLSLAEDSLYRIAAIPQQGEKLIFLITCRSMLRRAGRIIVAGYLLDS
jgi:sortase B